MTKARILIVEDEAVSAMSIQDTLDRQGYSVISIANSGDMAIIKAVENRPDVILMDIRLKGEMDGIEAAGRIRSQVDIPIIFMTAFADDDKLERAKLILPYGYLLKPVQDRELSVTIEMALYADQIHRERDQAQEALKKAHEELEQRVLERTKELQHEIDERKLIEESLYIAKKEAEQANKLKSEFLTNISHELRNPMHQILSYSKYGIDKINKPKEKLLHYFNQTRKSAERLMVLLNDLLDLSKMEAGKMDYTFVYSSVHQIVKEAASELNLDIIKKKMIISISEHPSLSTSVFCDYYKVGQVVRNLLSNAIKFTPEKKRIDIKIERNELINENNAIPALKLSIGDQGVGIPEDELVSIFDKFIQSSKTKTGAGGTGLGLSICKEIITAHNGKIWAENNPSGGATFSFMLPYEQEEV